MNNISKAALAAAGFAMAPAAATAETPFSAGAIGGSTGFGVEARYAVNEKIALRGGLSTLTWDVDETLDDVDYSGDLNYDAAALFVDYHPFASGFFVSGGFYFSGPELDLTATPSGPTEIGGVTYTPAQIGMLDVDADIGDTAPFIGIGWSNAQRTDSGLYFSALAGAAFYGDASANLEAIGGLLANDPTFLSDIAAEEANLEEDLDDFKTYPVIQIGLGYRF